MKNCNNCDFQKWLDVPPYQPEGKPFECHTRPICLYEKDLDMQGAKFLWCPPDFLCRHEVDHAP